MIYSFILSPGKVEPIKL